MAGLGIFRQEVDEIFLKRMLKSELCLLLLTGIAHLSHGFGTQGRAVGTFAQGRVISTNLGMLANVPVDARNMTTHSAASETPLQQSVELQPTPDLKHLQDSFLKLKSGSDIRGSFLNHGELSASSAVMALKRMPSEGGPAYLTPLAAYCMGYAFAKIVANNIQNKIDPPTICIGRDPRSHGSRYGAFVTSPKNISLSH